MANERTKFLDSLKPDRTNDSMRKIIDNYLTRIGVHKTERELFIGKCLIDGIIESVYKDIVYKELGYYDIINNNKRNKNV
jgi:hypothetical protein